jgi:hypothetical protein
LSINCRMTSLAMNSGYRFESMQSSGMRQLIIKVLSIVHVEIYFFSKERKTQILAAVFIVRW